MKPKHRVVMVYNYYQNPGGEDFVFEAESSLLSSQGHEVFQYTDSNKRIDEVGKLKSAIQTIWSKPAYKRMTKVIEDFRPDIVHVHNTYALTSPSIYYACRHLNVPVVQTLHNFRLMCPQSYLFRDGQVCEECIGKSVAWASLRHACYRDNRVQTGLIAGMVGIHHAIGTWSELVDVYVALTGFSRQKFIQGGLPAEKIMIKPNFLVADPGEKKEAGEYAVFVGKLSEQKGIRTLLSAWKMLPHTVPLKIIGAGDLDDEVEQFVANNSDLNIELLGWCTREKVLETMKSARFLIFPSTWYENFPVTLVESMACGLPVIASNLGAVSEIVHNEQTGLHFTPNDPSSLMEKVAWAWSHPNDVVEMGHQARKQYLRENTPEFNYKTLMDIYDHATMTKEQEISQNLGV